jgi:hypothetical protein
MSRTTNLLIKMCSIACFAMGEASVHAAMLPYRTVTVENIPHVSQKPDFCGEACVEMYLRKLGVAGNQDSVFDASGLDPKLGRGCYTRDLVQAVRKIGFEAHRCWGTVAADDPNAGLENEFAALHADLTRGFPTIVCTRFDERPDATEHFRLIVGYDADTGDVLYHDPAVKDAAYRRMAKDRLFRLWPLKYESNAWTVIRISLAHRSLQPASPATTFTNADFAQHLLKLKPTLTEGMHVVIEAPFVVIGDEEPEVVERRARETVRWAVGRLKKQYFGKDPNEVLDIWLLGGTASYEDVCVRLTGRKPTTPFGFYSSAEKALVMNISTGGGTLVHEIVHPFIESNFPDCPSWFNEGLASLYEQSASDRNGRIIGLTNWRLAGLQKAIRAGTVPSFQTLCSTTTNQFYHEDPGTNYSQARYLCFYLQERGLLRKYYHEFVKNASRDATGYQTLQRVVDLDDMDAFQKQWEAEVLKLRFEDGG